MKDDRRRNHASRNHATHERSDERAARSWPVVKARAAAAVAPTPRAGCQAAATMAECQAAATMAEEGEA